MLERYLEDFAPGQVYVSGRLRVERDRIKSFAREFDPQPFCLDEQAARGSLFEGLAASGWHTAAMTMRLLVASDLKPAGGIVGAGIDDLSWLYPVRPDDELQVVGEVLEVQPSQSRSDQGVVKLKMTTSNQVGNPVQIATASLIVRRRPT